MGTKIPGWQTGKWAWNIGAVRDTQGIGGKKWPDVDTQGVIGIARDGWDG